MLVLLAWVWSCVLVGFLAFDTHANGKASIVRQLPVSLSAAKAGTTSLIRMAAGGLSLLAAGLIGSYVLFHLLAWLAAELF